VYTASGSTEVGDEMIENGRRLEVGEPAMGIGELV